VWAEAAWVAAAWAEAVRVAVARVVVGRVGAACAVVVTETVAMAAGE
jgi:hypothetical protein